MRTISSSVALSLVLVLAATACSSDDDDVDAGTSSSSSSGGSTSSSGGETSSSSGGSSSGSSSSSGGASSSSSSGSSSGGSDNGLSAAVTDVHLTQADDCTLDLTVPGVDTPSDAADAKILAAIPQTNATYCEAGEKLSYDGDYTVAANEWGVLSIALSQSYFYDGAAHPDGFVKGHNFDIATGDELALESVLDAAGIDRLRAACVTFLTTNEELAYEEEQAQDACNLSIDGFEGEGGGNIQIEKTALRLYLELSHAEAAIAYEGVTVTWADFGTQVISPLVQTFVSKQ